MKTKRNNRVAKIAFTLLIVVTLFFSIGAGYQPAEGSSIISQTIAKYDALKVVADALYFEVADVETVAAVESKGLTEVTTVSQKATEEKEEIETVEETVEETVVIEETVETVSAVVETKTVSTQVANDTAAAEAARKAEEEAAAKAAAEEAARRAEEEAAAKAAAEEAARKAEEEAEAARRAEEEAAAATPSVQEWSIGLPGGTMNYYLGIGYDDLCYNLQSLIDQGYIVKYNNYFAGHNPGAMGHLSGIGVGSTVRVSWGGGDYRDYTIVSHTTGSGSFADVNFPGYGNLWDIVQSGGFVIQFCINGSNNFFLGY